MVYKRALKTAKTILKENLFYKKLAKGFKFIKDLAENITKCKILLNIMVDNNEYKNIVQSFLKISRILENIGILFFKYKKA